MKKRTMTPYWEIDYNGATNKWGLILMRAGGHLGEIEGGYDSYEATKARAHAIRPEFEVFMTVNAMAELSFQ